MLSNGASYCTALTRSTVIGVDDAVTTLVTLCADTVV
jgi:hypothetical protein